MPKYIGLAVVSCAILSISFASYQASNVDATVPSIQQSEKIKAVVAVDDLIVAKEQKKRCIWQKVCQTAISNFD